jgi:hypothetical protein
MVCGPSGGDSWGESGSWSQCVWRGDIWGGSAAERGDGGGAWTAGVRGLRVCAVRGGSVGDGGERCDLDDGREQLSAAAGVSRM